ncbi:MAG: hypothetical protein V7K15_13855 [Nostoc sp.]
MLAAEPPGGAFPARGRKRGFKGVLAEVDTNEHCYIPSKGVVQIDEN